MALRRMYGNMESSAVRTLMEKIPGRSVKTLTLWACALCRDTCVPLMKEKETAEVLLKQAETAVLCTNAKEQKLLLKDVKSSVQAMRKCASGEKDPVQQALLRAVSTACAIVTTATNSLGWMFYASIANAYAAEGLKAENAVLDACCEDYLQMCCRRLEEMPVEENEKPAKIDWNC